jgi:hypothetical protein
VGELRVDDPRSDSASEDGDILVTFAAMEGRVGNKNGIVKADEIGGLSVCSWPMHQGKTGEIGDVWGVFRRT